MQASVSRRAVLQTCLVTAGAAVGVPIARASDPVRRNGKSRMKLSLAAYSFREQLTGKREPKWTLDEFIDFCAAQDLDGTELTGYYFPAEITPQYLAHLKHKTFLLGLDVSGTAIRNDFCHPPGAARDKETAHVKRWIDYAAALGAPCIRIFSGDVPKGSSESEAIGWCVECIEECGAYGGTKGVFLALENHGGISIPADRLLRIAREVQTPWFGINLDTGNFREDPYAEIAKVAPYAINVQVKTEMADKGGAKRPADLGRIVRILRDSNYRGYVVLEYEAAEDPNRAVPRHLEELRKLLV